MQENDEKSLATVHTATRSGLLRSPSGSFFWRLFLLHDRTSHKVPKVAWVPWLSCFDLFSVRHKLRTHSALVHGLRVSPCPDLVFWNFHNTTPQCVSRTRRSETRTAVRRSHMLYAPRTETSSDKRVKSNFLAE